jgi:hypothetical protein
LTGRHEMNGKCPGAGKIRTPEIVGSKKCPRCAGSIEVYSDEVEARCPSCGQVVYNDIQSCIQWCRYAEECVGSDTFRELKKSLARGHANTIG